MTNLSVHRCDSFTFARRLAGRLRTDRSSGLQCNTKAKKVDLRPLFVKVLKAVDTSDEEALRRDLEVARKEQVRAERAEAAARIQLRMVKSELDRLKEQVYRPGSAAVTVGGGAAEASVVSSASAAAAVELGSSTGASADSPAGIVALDNDKRFVLEKVVQIQQTGYVNTPARRH